MADDRRFRVLLSHRRLRPARLLALLLLAAPVASAQILNSERIEAEFGSYGIEVLHAERWLRLSNLYSTHGDERITRTFAIVGFPEFVLEPLATPHRDVLAGASIGATMREAGWEVLKLNVSFQDFVVGDAQTVLRDGMQVPVGARLAMHAYRLDVERDDWRDAYAWIIEIHHPDYLSLDELREIYSELPDANADDAPVVRRLLEQGLQELEALDLALGE